MCHTCFPFKSHQLLRLLNSWLFNSGRLFFALPIIRFCHFKHAIWEQHQSSATPFFFGMSNSSKYNQMHFIYFHKHPGKDRKSTSHTKIHGVLVELFLFQSHAKPTLSASGIPTNAWPNFVHSSYYLGRAKACIVPNKNTNTSVPL